jgi:UDP-glucuronate 4-epimerase
MMILVTGGGGFIGSHLCEKLLLDGHRVAIIDDLNDFYAPSLKRDNLATVARAGPVTFHECDICDTDRVYDVVRETRPDVIVHLAARAGVRPSLEQPLLYERVNVRGTMVLLEAARRAHVRKFVFASSSSIYGVASQVPFREHDTENLPISPYAATKIAGEKMCYTYSHIYKLPVVALRFFTVYGPRQRPDLAVRKFADMILNGTPIPVFGDASSGRDYTFIDDIVDGIVRSIDYDCAYDVFNLGNSHPITLAAMISTLESALRKRAIVEQLPAQAGDVPITYADISKARKLIGYNPSVPFAEGVSRFAAWFSAQTQAAAACV